MSEARQPIDAARAIILAAFKILLPGSAVRAEGFSDIAEVILRGSKDKRARKTLIHRLEESTDFLTERLAQFEAVELRDLDIAERRLATEGTCKAIASIGLSTPEIVKSRIDPQRLYRHIQPHAQRQWRSDLLSEDAIAYGSRYLELACLYITTIVRELPELTTELLIQIYDATDQIGHLLQKGIATVVMPKYRQGLPGETSAFEAIYLSDVIQTYKDMELFGLTGMPPEFCRQPIEVAYITLRTNTMRSSFSQSPASARRARPKPNDLRDTHRSRTAKVDAAFYSVLRANMTTDIRGEEIPNPAKGTRILITGPAGSGKTTVAHWLAIRSAQHRFPELLSQWNNSIPFFVALRDIFQGFRRYSPTDYDLIAASSQRASSEIPGDWIRSRLRASSLIILDGVDELSDLHRSDFRTWIEKLERDYPLAHIIITSRPDGVDHRWFDQRGFTQLELQAMELPEIHLSIRRWFDAIITTDRRQEALYSKRKDLLLQHLQGRSAVRELAETPLVCAMLCAFYSYNLSDSAPKSRGELYQRVINALVHERDEARLFEQARLTNVSLGSKLALLQALARRMIEKSRSSITCVPIPAEIGVDDLTPVQDDDTAKEVLAERLHGMTPSGVSVDELLQLLLERSIVFRKVGSNEAAFVHRSLQEYLAATDYAESGAVDDLLRRAHQSSWLNIIAFAASKLTVPAASHLISGLLDRAEQHQIDSRDRRELLLLAAQCYGSAKRLDPQVSDRAEELLKTVLPPRDFTESELVSFAGEEILPWLADDGRMSVDTAVCCMRAAALVGGDGGMVVLARYAQSRDGINSVTAELLHDWQYFDANDYVRRVLASSSIGDHIVVLDTLPMIKATTGLDSVRRIRINVPNGLQNFEPWNRMMKLEELDYPNSSSLVSLSGIGGLTNLRRIQLSGAIHLVNIDDLERVATLREAYLARCRSIAGVEPLAKLGGLTVLVLDDCEGIGDFGELAKLRGLVTLSLNGCRVDDLNFLVNTKNLRRLAAVSRGGIKDTSSLLSKFQLRRLDIRLADVKVRDEISLPTSSLLEQLNMSGDISVNDVSVAGQCISLRSLSLTATRGLETLDSLAGLRRLRRLDVTGCDDLYDAGSLRTAEMLERLNLDGSSIVNVEFVRNMQGLRELRLVGCRYLKDLSGLEMLPSLEYVDLTGSAVGVLPEGVEARWASGGKVVVVRDSFDTVAGVLDGGFYGPSG